MKKEMFTSEFENYKESLLELIHNFNTVGSVFGNQNRNTIRIVPFNDIFLNIKSFKKPNLVNRVAYKYIRKSKAERSFRYANKLLEKGIDTPQPIAFFENSSIIGLTNSYYLSEHINTDLTFRELVNQPDFEDHERILRDFVNFTHKLHESEILFKDHSAGNTLIIKKENTYNFYLVDLNRMVFKVLSFEERIKNFSRLTPKKEMIAIMSDEYAKIAGLNYNVVFKEMWGETSKFRKRLERKKVFKKNLFFWK